MKVRFCISAEKVPDVKSYLLMRWMNFDGSHIFMEYDGIIYHSVGEGITTDYYAKFLKYHVISHEIEVDLKCNFDTFLKWFNEYRGTEYSQSQYLGFIFPFLKPLVRNKRKKAVCSEFCSWIVEDLAGLDLGNKDNDFMDPKETFLAIEAAVLKLKSK